MERLDFRAMGCQMLGLLDGDAPSASTMLAELPIWFAGWEQSLSRFRDDSELSIVNRSQGRWICVSHALWEAVDAALEAAAQSKGLVTPTMLDAIESTGYDRSFEYVMQASALSARSAIAHRPTFDRMSSWRDLERDPARRALRLPQGMRLDLGGTAKGWAADRAARILSAHGPTLVDAGGDIAISGPLHDASAWSIGIADPRRPEEDLEILLVDRGGVATSGRDYRRWLRDGIWQHHILDPRTGQPASTDLLSATIVAPSAREAEVAAKIVLILGSLAGQSWIEARPALAGLLVLERGLVLRSRRLQEYIAS